MHDAPVHARRAFRAGARGYVGKPELGETLLLAIRCVLGGEKFVSPMLREGLAQNQGGAPMRGAPQRRYGFFGITGH